MSIERRRINPLPVLLALRSHSTAENQESVYWESSFRQLSMDGIPHLRVIMHTDRRILLDAEGGERQSLVVLP
jgi:hypothetical protein